MKKIFLVLFLFVVFLPKTFAEEECPKFGDEPLVSASELRGNIKECREARENNTAHLIEDFSCPGGEFTLQDHNTLSDDRVSYAVAINVLMNEADKQVKEYMKKLQDSRNKDAVAWTNNIRECIHGKPNSEEKSIGQVYTQICKPSYMAGLLNSDGETNFVASSDTFPQEACQKIAQQKITAWNILGKNLMSHGIHKSFQNDRDEFVYEIQDRYRELLEKFHWYQKIVARAVSKVGVYIRNAVK